MSEKTKKESKTEPNLSFVGKSMKWNKKAAKLEKVSRQAPAFIINGRDKIKLPENLHKTAAFVEPLAAQTAKSLFPADFKDFHKTAGK